MPRGGIEGLQAPQIRPGLVRQDHAGAGIVFPRGGLHRHRRLGSDHMGIQDLQAIGPKNPGHGILRPPGLRAALHHLPADIQGIFHQGFPFRSRHWRPPLLSHHASSPRPLGGPYAGRMPYLTSICQKLQVAKPTERAEGSPWFSWKTHAQHPSIDGWRKIPYNEIDPICPLACKGGHIWRQPVGIA